MQGASRHLGFNKQSNSYLRINNTMKYVIRIKSMCNYLHNDISMYSLSELLKEYIDNENVKRVIALCKWRPYKDYLTVK